MSIQNNQLTQPFTDVDKAKLDTVTPNAEPNPPVASQADAIAGEDNSKMMTPQRVKEAITAQTGGSGVTGAQNVGSGEAVFKAKVGNTLQFKSIKAGTGVTLTSGTDEVTVNASAGGITSTDELPEGTSHLYFTEPRVSATPSVANALSLATTANIKASGSITAHSDIQVASPTVGQALVWNGSKWANTAVSGSGEVNTASNLGAGSQLFKSKVGVDLQFRSLVAGSGVTLTQNLNDITINASGGGYVTKYLTFDSGKVVIKASGLQADLDAVTATRSFLVGGEATLTVNKPTTVTYGSITAFFSAAEMSGRTAIRVIVPEPTGAASMDTAIRPIMMVASGTSGGQPYSTQQTTTLNGSNIECLKSGLSAQDQKVMCVF